MKMQWKKLLSFYLRRFDYFILSYQGLDLKWKTMENLKKINDVDFNGKNCLIIHT